MNPRAFRGSRSKSTSRCRRSIEEDACSRHHRRKEYIRMAQLITITLERELPEASAAYAKAESGKALARETDRLDTAARRKSVTAITSLLSESHAALIAQMREEGFDPTKMRLPPEQWYPAAEGLKTV